MLSNAKIIQCQYAVSNANIIQFQYAVSNGRASELNWKDGEKNSPAIISGAILASPLTDWGKPQKFLVKIASL